MKERDVNITDVNVTAVNVTDVNVTDINVTDVNVTDVNVTYGNVTYGNVTDGNVTNKNTCKLKRDGVGEGVVFNYNHKERRSKTRASFGLESRDQKSLHMRS